jgi:hypothetical protein
LQPAPVYTSADVVQLRKKVEVSQNLLARPLNISRSTAHQRWTSWARADAAKCPMDDFFSIQPGSGGWGAKKTSETFGFLGKLSFNV